MSAVTRLILILCHFQVSYMRPSDLDTSMFSLDYSYDYESDPYLPTNMGLQEAKMIDPWTLDFRRKLATQGTIGKNSLGVIHYLCKQDFQHF